MKANMHANKEEETYSEFLLLLFSAHVSMATREEKKLEKFQQQQQ